MFLYVLIQFWLSLPSESYKAHLLFCKCYFFWPQHTLGWLLLTLIFTYLTLPLVQTRCCWHTLFANSESIWVVTSQVTTNLQNSFYYVFILCNWFTADAYMFFILNQNAVSIFLYYRVDICLIKLKHQFVWSIICNERRSIEKKKKIK